MSRAIDDLMNEHDAILSALKILRAIAQRVAAGQPTEAEDIAAFIGFLKEFADKCHHGKEEGILFPALVSAGLPEQGGPVGVMLDEHAQGREWIRQMASSLAPALDAAAFTRAAQAYDSLLQAHIQKENNILFPMADKLLSAGQLEEIYEAFEAHEAHVIGAGRHEQLHALLKNLKGKYLTAA